MHQAHQTASTRTARDHEGSGAQQSASAQRGSPPAPEVTGHAGTAEAPGPRPMVTLTTAAVSAEPWRMAILVPEPVPPSIKIARDFTTGTLLDWDLRGLIQDATLVVSELVTNALRHGALDDGTRGERPELILWARAGCLVCVVIDSSASAPVRVPAGPAREDGRGLQVVHALASRWGWSMLGVRRKAVWAVLDGAETGRGPGSARAAAG